MHLDLLGLASFTWHAFEVLHTALRGRALFFFFAEWYSAVCSVTHLPAEGIWVVGEWSYFAPSCTGLCMGASVYFPGINAQLWHCRVTWR